MFLSEIFRRSSSPFYGLYPVVHSSRTFPLDFHGVCVVTDSRLEFFTPFTRNRRLFLIVYVGFVFITILKSSLVHSLSFCHATLINCPSRLVILNASSKSEVPQQLFFEGTLIWQRDTYPSPAAPLEF